MLTLLSNYRAGTLALLAPLLIATELGIALIALRDGWITEKARAWRSVLSNRHWIAEGRELANRNRVVGDAEMIRSMRTEISGMPAIESPPGIAFVNRLLAIYRGFVVGLLALFERR